MLNQMQQDLDFVLFGQQGTGAVVLLLLPRVRQIETDNVISLTKVLDRLSERGGCCQGSIHEDYTFSPCIENVPFYLNCKRAMQYKYCFFDRHRSPGIQK
jgi:hypothetical protein